MADNRHDDGFFSNPAMMILVLGIGAAAVIALAITLTSEPTGLAVGYAEESEVVDMDDEPVGEGDREFVDEQSGNAVSPEDTADQVTGVAEDGLEDEVEPLVPADGVEGEADVNEDLDTSLVVDPDDGGEGTEPDGGAAPVNPTPSGPEGEDGDALTTE